jgi:hypothetical protein
VTPDISPTTCLDFESAQAKSLQWLPLALRHKLDGARLKLTLKRWQSLAPKVRVNLLRILPENGFADAALLAGAHVAVGLSERQANMDEAEASHLLNCSRERAAQWLAASTSFARYALRKRERVSLALN